jgi:hypothetical protein
MKTWSMRPLPPAEPSPAEMAAATALRSEQATLLLPNWAGLSSPGAAGRRLSLTSTASCCTVLLRGTRPREAVLVPLLLLLAVAVGALLSVGAALLLATLLPLPLPLGLLLLLARPLAL